MHAYSLCGADHGAVINMMLSPLLEGGVSCEACVTAAAMHRPHDIGRPEGTAWLQRQRLQFQEFQAHSLRRRRLRSQIYVRMIRNVVVASTSSALAKSPQSRAVSVVSLCVGVL